jgi:hypothetical protein
MNKSTTEEVPPTYPTFSTTLGVLVNNNSQTAPTTTSAAPVTPSPIAPINASTLPTTTSTATPIIIQMPSFPYPYSQLDTSTINNKLPSISEFLFSLDQK